MMGNALRLTTRQDKQQLVGLAIRIQQTINAHSSLGEWEMRQLLNQRLTEVFDLLQQTAPEMFRRAA